MTSGRHGESATVSAVTTDRPVSLSTSLRNAAKRVPILDAVNRLWKAAATRRRYRETVQFYAGRTLAASPPPPPRLRLEGQRPRVLFVGTDEAQDRSGFIQALARLSDLRWFTKSDGTYGHNDSRGEAIRRRANADRLWELVQASEAPPHLILAQTWPTLMDPSVFSRIRQACGAIVVNLSMDDRHQYWGHRLGDAWSGTRGLVGCIDLALTAAPECVSWYEKEGCPALYFPEASDPEIFRPMPRLPKQHDVTFVGARYGVRERLVTFLRRAGVRVHARGTGWEEGRIATEGLPTLFATSRIVLGVGTIGHCEDFFALKLRDFDAPMSGSCYLTHDNADLRDLYSVGEEIVVYRTFAECLDRVRTLLADDGRREAIAAAGRRRAERDHTWQRRFESLFARLAGDA